MCPACLEEGYYSIMGWKGKQGASTSLITPRSCRPLAVTVGADSRITTHRTPAEAAGHHLSLPAESMCRCSGGGECPENPYRPEDQSYQQSLPDRVSSLAHEHRSPDGTGQPKGNHTYPAQIEMSALDVLHVPSCPSRSESGVVVPVHIGGFVLLEGIVSYFTLDGK
jgi:hypothetical protein